MLVGLAGGDALALSSTNVHVGTRSAVMSTEISLGLPPSVSPTSTKPFAFTSTTEYTPGGMPSKVNTPFESLVVVATTVREESKSDPRTPGMGELPTLSLLVSSKTRHLTERLGSSTKLLPVELNGAEPPIDTLILLRSPPSMSDTSKGATARLVSTTTYEAGARFVNK